MHVGTRQLDISQGGRLESTIHSHTITGPHDHSFVRIASLLFLTAVRQRSELRMAGPHTDILCRGPHADVVESTIVEGSTDSHWHEFNQALTCGTTHFVHKCSRKLRTAVAVDALALIQEDPQTFFGFGCQRVHVTLCKLIIRGLVRDQSRLIQHQRQTPEQRKVGLHLSVATGRNFLRRPPLRSKRFTDQSCIAGLLSVETTTTGIHPQTKHAVCAVHLLQGQWSQGKQLASHIRELASNPGHLDRTVDRAYCLRSQ